MGRIQVGWTGDIPLVQYCIVLTLVLLRPQPGLEPEPDIKKLPVTLRHISGAEHRETQSPKDTVRYLRWNAHRFPKNNLKWSDYTHYRGTRPGIFALNDYVHPPLLCRPGRYIVRTYSNTRLS